MKSPVFWTKSPEVLLRLTDLSALLDPSKPAATRFNGLTQVILILTLSAVVYCQSLRPLLMGAISLVIIAGVFSVRKRSVEGNTVRGCKKRTMPTDSNPFMNVMPSDYTQSPNRPPAALSYQPRVEKLIDEDAKSSLGAKVIDPRLFKELGGGGAAREEDLYFDQSMHQFYPTPSTQIPNGQTAFAEWCYGGMISAKEGNKKALLEGAPPNWVNG